MIMGYMVFKKLAQKLASDRQKYSGMVTNPIDDFDKHAFLNKLTNNAVEMYERKSDIKKFTKLALSDPENTSHNNIVKSLFENGVIDPEDDEKLLELSDNKRFLRDLGLID